MATRNFKPKASSNIIEGATPVEEQNVVTPVEQEGVAEATSTPAPLETSVVVAT